MPSTESRLHHAGCRLLWCTGSLVVTCGTLVPLAGMEPASLALQGGFLTTGPPGKSQPYDNLACGRHGILKVREGRMI